METAIEERIMPRYTQTIPKAVYLLTNDALSLTTNNDFELEGQQLIDREHSDTHSCTSSHAMASEETIIEFAPVTPAHKFAWRAFRGFVYGSPESPENAGKENARPLQTSPQKKVSLEIPSLSPQKRKRDLPLSPTKSILRTPGAPTPRAKSLRDVNVKFKSVSPEVQRNTSAPAGPKPEIVALEKEVDDLWQELEQSLEITKSPPHARPKVSKQTKKVVKSDVTVFTSVPTSPNSARDAYARRTEKEVKMILRREKKIRDYARRADEQNGVLKTMVAELKAENARLKAKLQQNERAQTTDGDNDVDLAIGLSKTRTGTGENDTRRSSSTEPTRQDRSKESLSRTEAFKRSLRGENDKPSKNDLNATRPPHRTGVVEEQDSDSVKIRQRVSSATFSQKADSWATRQVDHHKISEEHTTHKQKACPTADVVLSFRNTSNRSNDRPRRHGQTSPMSLTALATQLEPTPAPPKSFIQPPDVIKPSSTSSGSATSTIRPADVPTASSDKHARQISVSAPASMVSAPDRLAAARERLRKRQEQRKLGVGNATSLAFVGMMGDDVARRDDRKSSMLEKDESVLDWAGL